MVRYPRPAILLLQTLLLFVAVPLGMAPAEQVSAQQAQVEAQASTPRGMAPEDSYRLTTVGGVALSPNAAHLAFTVTTVNEAENNRSTTIWLQELRNGRPVGEPVRFTDPTRNSTSPSWSPDGRVLAFTSRRGDEEGSVWFIRVGGMGGEAYRVEGVRSTPTWSRDGSQMAFIAEPPQAEPSNARDNARAQRVAPGAISQPLDPARFDGYVITRRQYKRDGTVTYLPHPDHSDKRQLWVVPATGGEPRQITETPFNVGSFDWAPDGRFFIFAGNPEEDDEMNFDPSSALWVVPASGGEVQRIASLPGGQSAPAISPDGRRLAFLHTPAWDAETFLMVVDLDGNGRMSGEPRNLTAEWDRTAGTPSWTPDGRHIRWNATVNGNTHLFEVPAAGGAVRQITAGDRVISQISVSKDGRLMAYTSSDPMTPADIFVADAAGRSETRITSFNDALLAEIARQPAERITWRVADGTEIEGWVIRPVGHRDGERYPMILNIHGGPHSAYTNNFSPMFHILSGAGFYVFYLNPRGSTSYGNDFKHAIHAAWGIVDEEDFITGVEAVLSAYPDMDSSRLGVTGGSYGGFMSNWLTARTNLFAAAVTRASISSWEAMAGTTDSGQPHRAFNGAYHEQREIWRQNSPVSYVENVRAPTLIVHGENDYRTPLSEGEIWFSALKKLGVPTEFVIYPRSSHSISEPWLAADNQARTRQWFVHWLMP